LNDSRPCAERFLELAALLVSLRQGKWDRADGQQRKQDKRTPKKMRLNGGVLLFFYFCGPLDS